MNILSHLNYVHILVAAIAYFAIGSLWFSVIFGKMWVKLNGFGQPSEEDKKRMPMMFGMTFAYNFITTFAVACLLYFIMPPNIISAIKAGLLIGVGIVGVPIALNYMYTKRPFMLTLIDAGYHVVSIIVVSIIFTVWH